MKWYQSLIEVMEDKEININECTGTHWRLSNTTYIWQQARHEQLLEALNLLLTTEEQDLMLLQMELTEYDSISE